MKPKLSSPVRAGIRCVCLVAVAIAGASPVGATSADDQERARLAAERAAIESRYSARERECKERFVVTSCVDDARRERRQGLDALRSRQIQLDEARRRERTAERQAELAAKAAEDARRDREREARAGTQAHREPPRPLEPRHESQTGDAASQAARRGSGLDRPRAKFGGSAAKPAPAETAEARRVHEERSRAAYDARQQQAAEHRREVNEKNAERSKAHPPAAPLPVPASAPLR